MTGSRFRQLIHEFAKFAVIGVAGVVIANGVYDVLFIHLGLGPVTSTTIATIVATIASYLGNRYWSFRDRQRTGIPREIVVFAVLNGIALLIQDATVAFNYYLLGLGHDKLAGFLALNAGIVLVTVLRFWSYGTTSGSHRPAAQPGTPRATHGQRAARRRQHLPQIADAHADSHDCGSTPGNGPRYTEQVRQGAIAAGNPAMDGLTPASADDLPPLGELLVDDPFWRYPAWGLAREGIGHLLVWATATLAGHLAVVTETSGIISVTESAGRI